MVRRFKRLLQPAAILGFACVAIGVNLGIAYGLAEFKGNLQREYRVPAEEWGRFSGDVWSMQWSITSMALIFYAISVLAAPEQGRSESAALRRLAMKKLANPLPLSQEELEFWNRIAEEVKEDA